MSAYVDLYAALWSAAYGRPSRYAQAAGDASMETDPLDSLIRDHDERGLSNAQRKQEVQTAGHNWKQYKRRKYAPSRAIATPAPQASQEPDDAFDATAPLTIDVQDWREHVNDALISTSAEDGGLYEPDYAREYRDDARSWQGRPSDEQARKIWESGWESFSQEPEAYEDIHHAIRVAAGEFHASDWNREYDQRVKSDTEEADRMAAEEDQRRRDPAYMNDHLSSLATWGAKEMSSQGISRQERQEARAAVQAHEAHQEMLARGWTPEFISDSGSVYYRKGDKRFRIADHDVPATEERLYNRSQGGFSWANAASQLILPVHDVKTELDSMETESAGDMDEDQ